MKKTDKYEIENIIEIADINDWKKKKEILFKLHANGLMIDERRWRNIVDQHNYYFEQHLTDKFIAHSEKGYKLTDDKKEILESLEDNKKRSLNMLSKYSKVCKALGENDNLQLELEQRGVIS